jgi:hypothetical protein
MNMNNTIEYNTINRNNIYIVLRCRAWVYVRQRKTDLIPFHSIPFNSIQFNSIQFNSIQSVDEQSKSDQIGF